MAAKKTFNQPLTVKDFPTDYLSNRPQHTRNRILGFEWDVRNEHYVGRIILGAFRPKGLMLWDVPPRTLMHQTLIGNRAQILAGWTPIPADFFTMAKSFEQIEKLLKEGIEPPTWPDFDSAYIGNLIRVELMSEQGKPVGPPARVAMWGLSAED